MTREHIRESREHYVVTAINARGCSVSDTVLVTVSDHPSPHSFQQLSHQTGITSMIGLNLIYWVVNPRMYKYGTDGVREYLIILIS
jgi:hypothetical protein